MEKVWPHLSECMQFRSGLMHDAMFKYPWEDDEHAFDFNSYYPPIPDELACLRKLLDSMRKNNCLLRPTFQEDIRDCPFCHVDRYLRRYRFRDILATTDLADMDILNHPVWDMDPIPCPSHLFKHVWPEGGAPCIVTPEELEDTKKYLNQVRNSRGYDVDCSPHPNLVYQAFRKSDIDENSKVKLESTVIPHLQLKTGKNYKLEDILKIVSTDRRTTLVTFTAKVVEHDGSAASETFIATLSEYNDGTNSIMECLLKPDGDAPGPYSYPVFETQGIVIPDAMKKYMSTNHPLTEDPKLWDIPKTYGCLIFAPPIKDTYPPFQVPRSKRCPLLTAELMFYEQKLASFAGLEVPSLEDYQRKVCKCLLNPEDQAHSELVANEPQEQKQKIEKQKRLEARPIVKKKKHFEARLIVKKKKHFELHTKQLMEKISKQQRGLRRKIMKEKKKDQDEGGGSIFHVEKASPYPVT